MKGVICMNPTKQADLKELAIRWPSAFVSRQEVRNFSGGIINEKTLANLDSLGMGPAGRIRIGRKITYSVSSLIEWLESRATRLN
jgi:hypothetical protein